MSSSIAGLGERAIIFWRFEAERFDGLATLVR